MRIASRFDPFARPTARHAGAAPTRSPSSRYEIVSPYGMQLGRHHPPIRELRHDDGAVGGAEEHRPDRRVDRARPDRRRLVGLAAQARAVACGTGLGRIGEEGDVVRERLADAARRAAVDAGRADGGDEPAVVGGIGAVEGAREVGAHASGTL
jgi:hypothetical protein